MPTIKKIMSNSVFIINIKICDQLDIEFDIFMSMIQIIIKGFLSMRVKKLVQASN